MDETRERLLERFRAYLEATAPPAPATDRDDDAADRDGDWPDGERPDASDVAAAARSPEPEPQEPPPAAPDLFSLFAELAALRNEVKLESRQVKGALDQFREVFEALERANRQLAADLTQQRQDARALADGAERDLLLELIELRDRLRDAHDQAVNWRPGMLARASGAADFVEGMGQGLAMTLRRLDESLLRREVRPVRAQGQSFDPRTMRAIEVIRDPGLAPGLVVREVRTGFLRGESLLRLADVIVNKSEEPPAS